MNQPNKQDRIDAAEKFLSLLFGAVADKKFGYFWTKKDEGGRIVKATYPFDVSNAAARRNMASKAIELSDAGFDVYISVNVGNEPPLRGQRHTKRQIALQTATVTDIDTEGGAHVSHGDKNYPPNFDAARALLPFEPSLLVNSGYGLHGYCLYSEPITVTADNFKDLEQRNRDFISVIRSRAGVFDGAVDGVHDLPRILRMPGTFNYKCGRDNAPLCHVVEVNDVRFTPAEFDAHLQIFLDNSLENLRMKNFHLQNLRVENFDLEKSARGTNEPTRNFPVGCEISADEPAANPGNTDAHSDLDLENTSVVANALQHVKARDLTRDEWFAVGCVMKRYGFELADFDRWSNDGDARYSADACRAQWQSMKNAAELQDDAGYKIGTLIKIASQHSLRFFIFRGDASDLDFARRLERLVGNRVRWLTDSERWLIYAGGVWKRAGEKNSCVLPLVREVADLMSQHAQSDDERKLADRLKSTRKMASSLTALKALKTILITSDDLDTHNELLNVLNGVVDLQTGNLYPAAPELLISRQCRAAYDPQADSELVNKFFRDIMPDEETRAGLLRWLGYCLTGATSEERFLIWRGRGCNGKGVLSLTLIYLFGSYGTGLPTRALLKNNRNVDADKATTGLNPLEGVRFAISEELPADAQLDVSLIKNLTGGDPISLRLNYCEYRTIQNFAKLNLSGNYMPRLENINDNGLLRRLVDMPFEVTFGTPANPADRSLKQKMLLPENLRGLLRLLVNEAVKWYNGGGLIISPSMRRATEEHLAANDFVATFISDNYTRDANATVKAKSLIDELKAEYPAECRLFSRADLIKLIERVGNVTYCEDNHRYRFFKGIGKLAPADVDYDFCGEPINPKDVAMP